MISMESTKPQISQFEITSVQTTIKETNTNSIISSSAASTSNTEESVNSRFKRIVISNTINQYNCGRWTVIDVYEVKDNDVAVNVDNSNNQQQQQLNNVNLSTNQIPRKFEIYYLKLVRLIPSYEIIYIMEPFF